MSDDREMFWLGCGLGGLGTLLFALLLAAGLLGGGSVVAAILLALAGMAVVVGVSFGLPLALARRVSRPEREPDGEWITEIDAESLRIESVRFAEFNGVPPELGPLPSVSVSNLNGVPWHEAPIPPRRHRCTPQTKGWVNYFTSVERCACGAIRSRRGDPWRERNSREMAERPVR